MLAARVKHACLQHLCCLSHERLMHAVKQCVEALVKVHEEHDNDAAAGSVGVGARRGGGRQAKLNEDVIASVHAYVKSAECNALRKQTWVLVDTSPPAGAHFHVCCFSAAHWPQLLLKHLCSDMRLHSKGAEQHALLSGTFDQLPDSRASPR